MMGEMATPRSLVATRLLASSLAALVVTACSLIASVDEEQCATDGDCAARGGSNAVCSNKVCVLTSSTTPGEAGTSEGGGVEGGRASLDCIGNNPVPKPASGVTKVDLLFKDVFTGGPISAVRLLVCTSLTDPSCTSPAKTIRAEADGHVRFDLDTSTKAFDGYFDVQPIRPDGTLGDLTGADTSAYIPSRFYYTSAPIAQDYSDYWELLTFDASSVFAALFGKEYDKTQGSAFLISEDCNSVDRGGFSFVVDSTSPETHGFYLQNQTPSTTATQTDEAATGGFINIPTGSRTFTMVEATTKRSVGSLTTYVRPLSIVYAKIRPSFTH